MSPRTPSASSRLASHGAALATFAPVVVAQRLSGMGAALSTTPALHQHETWRMLSEKSFVWQQAWWAMGFEAFRIWSDAATQFTRGVAFGSTTTLPAQLARIGSMAPDAGMRLAAAGMAPVAKRVRANAKRLSRRR